MTGRPSPKRSVSVKAEFKDPNDIAGQYSSLASAMKRVVNQVISREALVLRRAIRTGIISQAPAGKAFKPLAESTKAMKGSSKALIDKGDLVGSISNSRVSLSGKMAAQFVGVNRTAIGKSGQALANVAEIHEFGTKKFSIPITPKLRGWWGAMAAAGIFASRLSGSKTHISHPGVPERPFLRPPFEAWKKEADVRFRKAVLAGMNKAVNRDFVRKRY